MDLRDIERRLRRGDRKGSAQAAGEALRKLAASSSISSEEDVLRFALSSPRAAGIVFTAHSTDSGASWNARCLILHIKCLFHPFAAMAVQAAFRRYRKRKCAVTALQTAALEFLYKPGGWAQWKGAHALGEIVA